MDPQEKALPDQSVNADKRDLASSSLLGLPFSLSLFFPPPSPPI